VSPRLAFLAATAVAALSFLPASALASAGAGSGVGLTIDTAGRVVVAANNEVSPHTNVLHVFRYRPSGKPDRTFGKSGREVTRLKQFCDRFAAVSSVTTDARGRILVAGYAKSAARHGLHCSRNPGAAVLMLLRYRPNGKLDPSFGSKGITTVPHAKAYGITVDPAGRILVAGVSNSRFTLFRFRPTGRLDSTFGDDGVAMAGPYGFAGQPVVGPGGSTIVAGGFGDCPNPACVNGFGLAWFNHGGSLDATFGSGGTVRAPRGERAAPALALTPLGGIVTPTTASFGFGIDRYTTTGSLDTTFGSGGHATTSLPFASADQVYVDALDRPTAVGLANVDSATPPLIALARYQSNGTADPSFGSGGATTTPIPRKVATTVITYVSSATDGKGRIYAAVGISKRLLIVRYTPNGILDPRFGSDGDVLAIQGHA
jgi:uncharacterized delta-60 repeat protein